MIHNKGERMPWRSNLRIETPPSRVLIPLEYLSIIASDQLDDSPSQPTQPSQDQPDIIVAIIKKRRVATGTGCGAVRRYRIITNIIVRGGVRLDRARFRWSLRDTEGYYRELPLGRIMRPDIPRRIITEGAAVFQHVNSYDDVHEYKITTENEYDAVLAIFHHGVVSRSHNAIIKVITPPIVSVSEASSCAADATASIMGLWPADKPIIIIKNNPPYRGSDVDWEIRRFSVYAEEKQAGWVWVATHPTLEDAEREAREILESSSSSSPGGEEVV